MKTFDLTGKTALITGGAGLLGIEHAGALLASGANVILTDSNKESLKKAKHSLSKENFSSKLYIEELDVSSEDKMGQTKQRQIADGLEKFKKFTQLIGRYKKSSIRHKTEQTLEISSQIEDVKTKGGGYGSLRRNEHAARGATATTRPYC